MDKRLYSACDSCPLKHCEYVPSFIPSGPIKFVALGEAPGAQEARMGIPFVGPSGSLLSKALERLGVDFETQVARINAVGCKAPHNEVPFEALLACQDGLRAELEDLAGVNVLSLGGTATQALDSLSGYAYRDGIMKRRGTWYDLPDNDAKYLAALHPAFIMRSPQFMQQFYADLRKIASLIPTIDVMSTKYLVASNDNFEAILEQLRALPPHTPIAFDVETRDLDTWGSFDRTPAPLLCIVLTWRLDFSLIIPADTLTLGRAVYLGLALDRLTTIAHNGKFDQNVLQARGLGFKVRLDHDTMLISYCLNEQTKGAHGLKVLASQLLNAPDYEEELIISWFKAHKITDEKRDYSKLPVNQLYRYAAIDGVATLALFNILYPKLEQDGVLEAYNMLMKHSAVVQAAEYTGIKIDRAYLLKVELRLEAELEYYTEELYKLLEATQRYLVIGAPYYTVPKQIIAPYLKEGKSTKPFNPGSDEQMSWALYEVFKLKHIKPLSYKTKESSTNEEALEALPDHPFVKLLRQHRRVAKILSSYVRKLLKLADANDRVHVDFNLIGTETGRLSARDGLHGIPRAEDVYGKMIQGAFIAAEGCKLIKADFSQAELRAFAAESGEEFLLEQYRRGEDLHLATAKLVFAKEFAKSPSKEEAKYLRQIAKQVNFGGLVYLGGPSGIAAMLHGYNIEITPQQLAPILRDYKAKMPQAIAWQVAQFRKAKKDGEVRSRLGRKRRFLIISEETIEEIRKASVNAPIQSVASDLNLLAAYELQFKEGYNVIHMIHDSIILEVPEAQATWAAAIVKGTMERVAASIYPELPWIADVEVANRLYEDRPNL